MPRPDSPPGPAAFPPAMMANYLPGRPLLPLQGVTVLAVEDSRYACDALRLMCQRSGARLRRAESLAVAEAHLRCYRPDVVIVDLGLPDGRGEDLIRNLAGEARPVVLGSSGDPDGRRLALSAGAAGFLDKPLPGLALFQAQILAHLPGAEHRPGPMTGDGAATGQDADPLALADDLAQAAEALERDPSPEIRAYLAGFLSGLARQAEDGNLARASAALQGQARATEVSGLLRQRITGQAAFGRRG